MKKYLLLLLLIPIAIYSCHKNGNAGDNAMITVKAKIVNTGTSASDGCGYVVETDSVNHVYTHPTNLDAAYMIDQLRVTITYQQTHSDYQCGNGKASQPIDPTAYNAIYINSISKR